MLLHEAENNSYGEKKNKSIQTDIVWLSLSHPLIVLCFQPFCPKIQNAVCGLHSQRNGPQCQLVLECSRDGLVLCNLRYFVTQGEIHVI